MHNKPILAVDMDDVITDTFQQSLDWYARDFGKKYNKQDLQGNYLADVIPSEHREKIQQYFFTKGFFRELKPIPGAIETLSMLQDSFEVFVVTAAQQFPQCLTEKNEWLDEYMPFIDWRYRVFCGHKYFLNAKYLIDDHAYNFEKYIGHPILFTAPHNTKEDRYTRADNWDDVVNILKIKQPI
ncbi:5' nucleotidase, NT5C type [Membranihabitans marinus]|uniref:5' nucleotidase, NT5C type n=1 Tax=Membranihabitans marinus TaxID=1227546 RepID=UPI001F3BF970|nr:5'(3')-deoxyribonucleotidase [Membranihabitans marinus]